MGGLNDVEFVTCDAQQDDDRWSETDILAQVVQSVGTTFLLVGACEGKSLFSL